MNSSREHDANAELGALGAAYQGGVIGRNIYRERRRGVINALRAHNDVTERKPIVADEPRDGHVRSLPRERPRHALRWLALATTVAAAVLAAAWLVWGIKGGVR
jgi:hypothetical protein